MGLNNPSAPFGIHSVTPYDPLSGEFYGTIKVLDSSSLSLSSEQVDLTGGSNKYPYASEDGKISSEMSLKVGQIEGFMIELFLGRKPTYLAAESTGNVSTVGNVKGASMVSATGLASVTVIPTTGAANLKYGKYLVRAKTATSLEVFMATDIDHGSGTKTDFVDDSLVVATLTAFSTGTSVDAAALGLKFTAGASATAFVVGDTAEFYVRPKNAGGYEVDIGAPSDVLPEFGAIIMAQARANGELFEVEAYRCKGSGMPLPFESFAWSKPEIKAKLLYDAGKGKVFTIRKIQKVK